MTDNQDHRPLLSPDKFATNNGLLENGLPINVEIDVQTGEEKVVENTQNVKPLPQRWYILAVFIGLGFCQNLVWNTWGPISVSAALAFDWSNATIALMTNWGPIAYIISAAFFSWLLSKSFRLSIIITTLCLAIGAALRCVTSQNPYATWLIHLGQLTNGLAGPVLMAGPPVLSALWFPPNQRATATGLGCGLGALGSASAFLLGPYLVSDVSVETNLHCDNKISPAFHQYNCTHVIDDLRHQIMHYMYIVFAPCALMLVLVLAYFPSQPRIAPSLSATIQRSDFLPGLKQLLRQGGIWMLALPYGLSNGVLGVWTSVIDINLKPFRVNEVTAGWMGFACSLTGQLSSVFVGMFSDVFSRRMKLFIVTLYSIAAVMFLVFALICSNILPFNLVVLFVTTIFGQIGVFGATPLFYELSCEAAYPVAEGVTNMIMTWLNNLAGLVFLLVLMKPSFGTAWMNWVLLGSVAVCVPVFVFYRERYTRLDLDTRQQRHILPQSENQSDHSVGNHVDQME